jgi:hypothetical protein
MREVIGVVTNENASCCPNLSLKTRITGFAITFVIGIILEFLSLPFLPGAFIGEPTFAILYTLGNITAICS